MFKKLTNYSNNLFYFFKIIYKRLFLPVYFKVRVVAGKKHLIPFRLINEKKFCFMWRLIIESSSSRTESCFADKLYFELIDIFNNKGLTLKRRLQICKDIKSNTPNLRFLKW